MLGAQCLESCGTALVVGTVLLKHHITQFVHKAKESSKEKGRV